MRELQFVRNYLYMMRNIVFLFLLYPSAVAAWDAFFVNESLNTIPGLISFWPLAAESGLNDVKGGINAAFTNGPPPSYVAGPYGEAATAYPTDKYASPKKTIKMQSALFDFGASNASFTWGMWVRIIEANPGSILDYAGPSNYQMSRNSSTTLSVSAYGGHEVSGIELTMTNTWRFIAGSFTAANPNRKFRFYSHDTWENLNGWTFPSFPVTGQTVYLSYKSETDTLINAQFACVAVSNQGLDIFGVENMKHACRAFSVSCNPPCMSGGFCVGFNICKCPPGWTGPTCDTVPIDNALIATQLAALPSLVAYWPLTIDYKMNDAFTAGPINGVTPRPAVFGQGPFGSPNTAFQSFLSQPRLYATFSSPDIDFETLQSSWTLAMWLKPNALNQPFFSYTHRSNPNAGSGPTGIFGRANTQTNTHFINTTEPSGLSFVCDMSNAWTFFAVTFNEADLKMKVFCNDAFVGAYTATARPPTSPDLNLLYSHGGNTVMNNAFVACASIHNDALSRPGLLLVRRMCRYFSVECRPPCLNGGTCVGYNDCSCAAGWTGATCATTTTEEADNIDAANGLTSLVALWPFTSDYRGRSVDGQINSQPSMLNMIFTPGPWNDVGGSILITSGAPYFYLDFNELNLGTQSWSVAMWLSSETTDSMPFFDYRLPNDVTAFQIWQKPNQNSLWLNNDDVGTNARTVSCTIYQQMNFFAMTFDSIDTMRMYCNDSELLPADTNGLPSVTSTRLYLGARKNGTFAMTGRFGCVSIHSQQLTISQLGAVRQHCKRYQARCSPSCQNGGTCTGWNLCSCPAGFTGQRCGINVNQSSVAVAKVDSLPALVAYWPLTVDYGCQDAKTATPIHGTFGNPSTEFKMGPFGFPFSALETNRIPNRFVSFQSASLDFQTQSSSWTIGGWVNILSNEVASIFEFYSGSPLLLSYLRMIDKDLIYHSRVAGDHSFGSVCVVQGKWNYLAVSFNQLSSTYNVFCNNTFVNMRVNDSSLTSDKFYIGGRPAADEYGRMLTSCFSVHNAALTINQIIKVRDTCRFFGVSCQPGCQNGGICVGFDICQCQPGFTGLFCGIAIDQELMYINPTIQSLPALVAYWPLVADYGAKDVSPFNRHGVFSINRMNYPPGPFNLNLTSIGTNSIPSYVQIENPIFNYGSNSWTWAGFVRVLQNGVMPLIFEYITSDPTVAASIWHGGSNLLYFDGTTGTASIPSCTMINSWVFIAVSYDQPNAMIRLWCDLTTASNTVTLAPLTTGKVNIGFRPPLTVPQQHSDAQFACVSSHIAVLNGTELQAVKDACRLFSVQCLSPCLNGGTCIGAELCKCPPTHSGQYCNLPVCHVPCINGGNCTAPDQCTCPPLFTGRTCGTLVAQLNYANAKVLADTPTVLSYNPLTVDYLGDDVAPVNPINAQTAVYPWFMAQGPFGPMNTAISVKNTTSGLHGYVQFNSAHLNFTSTSFTIATWVKMYSNGPIFEYFWDNASLGTHMWQYSVANSLWVDPSGTTFVFNCALLNQWQFVALVYDQPKLQARAFCGDKFPTNSSLNVTAPPRTTQVLTLGHRLRPPAVSASADFACFSTYSSALGVFDLLRVREHCRLFSFPTCQYPCMNGGTCIGPDMCSCPVGWSGRTCSCATWQLDFALNKLATEVSGLISFWPLTSDHVVDDVAPTMPINGDTFKYDRTFTPGPFGLNNTGLKTAFAGITKQYFYLSSNQLDVTGSSFSIAMWMKMPAPGVAPFWEWALPGVNQLGSHFWVNPSNYLNFNAGNGAAFNWTCLLSGVWRFVGVTFDISTETLTLFHETNPSPMTITVTQPLVSSDVWIGYRGFPFAENGLNGEFACFSLYAKALNRVEMFKVRDLCRLFSVDCSANPCMNGGSCVGYNLCLCPPAWTDTRCSSLLFNYNYRASRLNIDVPNLVAYWPLSLGYGQADAKTSNQINGYTPPKRVLSTFVTGPYGHVISAFSCDGYGNYIQFYSDQLNLAGSLTIATWVKVIATVAKPIFEWSFPTAANYGLSVWHGNPTNLVTINPITTAGINITCTMHNQWTFIAVVYNAGDSTIKFFCASDFATPEITGAAAPLTSSYLSVGARSSTSGTPINDAHYACVSLYSAALTKPELLIVKDHCRFFSVNCSAACNNGGTCIGVDVCMCPAGFTGSLCELLQGCDPPCGVGGTCLSNDTCACSPEWTGPSCLIALSNFATNRQLLYSQIQPYLYLPYNHYFGTYDVTGQSVSGTIGSSGNPILGPDGSVNGALITSNFTNTEVRWNNAAAFSQGTSSFTISMYYTSAGNYNTSEAVIFQFRNNANQPLTYLAQSPNANTLMGFFAGTNQTLTLPNCQLYKWTYVAMGYDNVSQKAFIYCDTGADVYLLSSSALAQPPTTAQHFYLAKNLQNVVNYKSNAACISFFRASLTEPELYVAKQLCQFYNKPNMCPVNCLAQGCTTRLGVPDDFICAYCISGYNGTYCNSSICNPTCTMGGYCSSPNVCTCYSGWTDIICSTPICTPACPNRTDCTAPNTCTCSQGWTGAACSIPMCNQPCQNGGTCVGPDLCSCLAGWTGRSCAMTIYQSNYITTRLTIDIPSLISYWPLTDDFALDDAEPTTPIHGSTFSFQKVYSPGPFGGTNRAFHINTFNASFKQYGMFSSNQLNLTGSSFTVAMWVQPLLGTGIFWEWAQPFSTSTSSHLQTYPANTLSYNPVAPSSTSVTQLAAWGSIWRYIAVVYNFGDQSIRLFFDDNFFPNSSYSPQPNVSPFVYLGTRNTVQQPGMTHNCRFACVSLYSKALSRNELLVARDHCQMFTVDCTANPCQNGATCIAFNKCQCQAGWTGNSCGTAMAQWSFAIDRISTEVAGLMAFYPLTAEYNFRDATAQIRLLSLLAQRSFSQGPFGLAKSAFQAGMYGTFPNYGILLANKLDFANTSFTVAFWVNVNTTGYAPFLTWETPPSPYGLEINQFPSSNILYSNTQQSLDSSANVQKPCVLVNQWQFVGGTFDAATQQFQSFCNNDFLGPYPSAAPKTSSTAYLGYSSGNPPTLTDGSFACLSFYNRSLTITEIRLVKEHCRLFEPFCSLPCLNGGLCVGRELCNCPAGYTGIQCEYDPCGGCGFGSTCLTNGTCICAPGWTGPQCLTASGNYTANFLAIKATLPPALGIWPLGAPFWANDASGNLRHGSIVAKVFDRKGPAQNLWGQTSGLQTYVATNGYLIFDNPAFAMGSSSWTFSMFVSNLAQASQVSFFQYVNSSNMAQAWLGQTPNTTSLSSAPSLGVLGAELLGKCSFSVWNYVSLVYDSVRQTMTVSCDDFTKIERAHSPVLTTLPSTTSKFIIGASTFPTLAFLKVEIACASLYASALTYDQIYLAKQQCQFYQHLCVPNCAQDGCIAHANDTFSCALCKDGWTGVLCDVPICSNPCLNGGSCSLPDRCDCPIGWTGRRCGISSSQVEIFRTKLNLETPSLMSYWPLNAEFAMDDVEPNMPINGTEDMFVKSYTPGPYGVPGTAFWTSNGTNSVKLNSPQLHINGSFSVGLWVYVESLAETPFVEWWMPESSQISIWQFPGNDTLLVNAIHALFFINCTMHQRWQYVGFVYQASNLKLQILCDSMLSANFTLPSATSTSQNAFIGARFLEGVKTTAKASFACVSIYTSALTQDQFLLAKDHCQLFSVQCAKPCMNNGTCVGYNLCLCQAGWTGPICEMNSCGCGLGSTCLTNGSCACAPGWTGPKCLRVVTANVAALQTIKTSLPTPIANWPLNSMFGPNDASGNLRHGVQGSTVTTGIVGPGVSEWGIVSGVETSTTVGTGFLTFTDAAFDLGTSSWTFAFFVTTAGYSNGIASLFQFADNVDSPLTWLKQSPNTSSLASSSGSPGFIADLPNKCSLSTWSYVAIAYDSSTMRFTLFCDDFNSIGWAVSNPLPAAPSLSNKFYLAFSSQSPTASYAMQLACASFYAEALNLDAVYNSKLQCQLYNIVCPINCQVGTCYGLPNNTFGCSACQAGWTGIYCDIPVCTNPCQNGNCTAPDVCTCPTGWTDATCGTAICNPPCDNGNCTAPNTCACSAGWAGSLCDEAICASPCLNGGNCTAPDTCDCPVGLWTDAVCATPICTHVCANNGTCDSPNNCTCQPGWSGADCSVFYCEPPCHSTGGVCSNANLCTCNLGWVGAQCEVPICASPCLNDGNCTAPDVCTCTDSWTGLVCETPICQPSCAVGTGTCTAPDVCTCSVGWTGQLCDVAICSSICENGGSCTAPDVCTCLAGLWTGATCSIPVCAQTCHNGGSCSAPNTCTCAAGWTGNDCSTFICTPMCNNKGGQCSGPNQCTCNPGWVGARCESAVCTQPCLNGGACTEPNVCTCVVGWKGPVCENSTAHIAAADVAQMTGEQVARNVEAVTNAITQLAVNVTKEATPEKVVDLISAMGQVVTKLAFDNNNVTLTPEKVQEFVAHVSKVVDNMMDVVTNVSILVEEEKEKGDRTTLMKCDRDAVSRGYLSSKVDIIDTGDQSNLNLPSRDELQKMYAAFLKMIVEMFASLRTSLQPGTSSQYNGKFFSATVFNIRFRDLPSMTLTSRMASCEFPAVRNPFELIGTLPAKCSGLTNDSVVPFVLSAFIVNVMDVDQPFNMPTVTTRLYCDREGIELAMNPANPVTIRAIPTVRKANLFKTEKVEVQCDVSKVKCELSENVDRVGSLVTFPLVEKAGDFIVIFPKDDFMFKAYLMLNSTPTRHNFHWMIDVGKSASNLSFTISPNVTDLQPPRYNYNTDSGELRLILSARTLARFFGNDRGKARFLLVQMKRDLSMYASGKWPDSACQLQRSFGYHLRLGPATTGSLVNRRKRQISEDQSFDDGFELEPESTESEVVFKSSYFGDFGADLVITPNTIEFNEIFDNFAQLISENSAVLAFQCVAIVFFLVGLCFAYKFDREDLKEWAFMPLTSNKRYMKNRYLVSVHYGKVKHFKESPPKVYLRLDGNANDTTWRLLDDGLRPNFNGKHPANFTLNTQLNLGRLEAIDLLVESAGRRNFQIHVDRVVIVDVAKGFKYVFLIKSTLDTGDQAHVEVASEDELKGYTYLISGHSKTGFTEIHPWISIAQRPLPSNWTRVERLACVVSALFMAMLVNAMFYGKETKSPAIGLSVGGIFTISWFTLWTSFIGCVIVIPPTAIIAIIFKKVQRASAEKSHWMTVFNLKKQIPKPIDQSADAKVGSKKKVKEPFKLPYKCVIIAWLLVAAAIGTSSFMVIMYSLSWGKDKSLAWLSGMFMSVFQDILLIQPVKTILSAIFSATVHSLPSDGMDLGKLTYNERNDRQKVVLFYRLRGVLTGIFHHAIYVVVFAVVIATTTNPYAYLQIDQLRSHYSLSGIQQVRGTVGEFTQIYDYLEQKLLPNLLNGNQLEYGGYFVTPNDLYANANPNVVLLGPVRFKQLRVSQYSCPLSQDFGFKLYKRFDESLSIHGNLSRCQKEFSNWAGVGEASERRDFNGSWFRLWDPAIELRRDNLSVTTSPWIHREDDAVPYSGWEAPYAKGGYYVDLPRRTLPQAQSYIRKVLRANRWLDNATTVVYIDFNLFNAQTNLFIPVKIVFEALSAGGMSYHIRMFPLQLYQYSGASSMLVFIVQGLWILILISHAFKIGRQIKKEGWTVFRKNGWNLLDLVQILWGFGVVCMFAARIYVIMQVVSKIQTTKSTYVSLDLLSNWEDILFGLFGIQFFMAMFLFFRHLSVNKHWAVLLATLSKGKLDLASYGTIFGMVTFFFAGVAYLIMGNQSQAFSTFARALMTLIQAIIGTIDFTAVNMKFYLVICMAYNAIVIFIGGNIFVTLIMAAYADVVSGDVENETSYDADLARFIATGVKEILARTPNKTVVIKRRNREVDESDEADKQPKETGNVDSLLAKLDNIVHKVVESETGREYNKSLRSKLAWTSETMEYHRERQLWQQIIENKVPLEFAEKLLGPGGSSSIRDAYSGTGQRASSGNNADDRLKPVSTWD